MEGAPAKIDSWYAIQYTLLLLIYVEYKGFVTRILETDQLLFPSYPCQRT